MPRWDLSAQHEYQSVKRDWIYNQANLRSALFKIIYLLIIAPTEITQINERLSISTTVKMLAPYSNHPIGQNISFIRTLQGKIKPLPRPLQRRTPSERGHVFGPQDRAKESFSGPTPRAKARIMAETGQVRNNSPHPPYFELQIYKP